MARRRVMTMWRKCLGRTRPLLLWERPNGQVMLRPPDLIYSKAETKPQQVADALFFRERRPNRSRAIWRVNRRQCASARKAGAVARSTTADIVDGWSLALFKVTCRVSSGQVKCGGQGGETHVRDSDFYLACFLRAPARLIDMGLRGRRKSSLFRDRPHAACRCAGVHGNGAPFAHSRILTSKA